MLFGIAESISKIPRRYQGQNNRRRSSNLTFPIQSINLQRAVNPRRQKARPRQIIARSNSVKINFRILQTTKNTVSEDIIEYRDRQMYLSGQLCRNGNLKKAWSSNGKRQRWQGTQNMITREIRLCPFRPHAVPHRVVVGAIFILISTKIKHQDTFNSCNWVLYTNMWTHIIIASYTYIILLIAVMNTVYSNLIMCKI